MNYVTVMTDALRELAQKHLMATRDSSEDSQVAMLRLANRTTGLEVLVDWAEFRPVLQLSRLRNGSFPPSNEPIVAGSTLNSFDVDDLLLLRGADPSPVGKLFAYRDAVSVTTLLTEYSAALEQCAADVLGGDFSVFEKLNEIVLKRAKG